MAKLQENAAAIRAKANANRFSLGANGKNPKTGVVTEVTERPSPDMSQQGVTDASRGQTGTVLDPETVTRMPDPNDPVMLEEERRRLARRRLQGGRLSTILTDTLQTRIGTG